MHRKLYASTDEELFWIVSPCRSSSAIHDDWIVFEYRTGKVVSSRALEAELRKEL
jgi:hypothetical protein